MFALVVLIFDMDFINARPSGLWVNIYMITISTLHTLAVWLCVLCAISTREDVCTNVQLLKYSRNHIWRWLSDELNQIRHNTQSKETTSHCCKRSTAPKKENITQKMFDDMNKRQSKISRKSGSIEQRNCRRDFTWKVQMKRVKMANGCSFSWWIVFAIFRSCLYSVDQCLLPRREISCYNDYKNYLSVSLTILFWLEPNLRIEMVVSIALGCCSSSA